MCKKITTEIFIKEAKLIHGNKYDYSLVNYKNSLEKVCIICKKHNFKFWQTPNSHLQGQGCPKCKNEKTGNRCRKTLNDFIKEAKLIHGDKYDYSDITYYKDNKTKIKILCPIHGYFLQAPIHHLKGCGCPKCKGSKISKTKHYTTEKFINLAKKVHNDKYDYSKVDYINSKTKIEIICSKHGSFFSDPSNHLQGKGCPKCSESKIEILILELLNLNNINYLTLFTWDWLVYKENQKVDFYLPEYNIVIECQGQLHFESVEFFGGEEKYKETIKRDQNKLKLCTEHGISILYYSNLGKDYNYPYKVFTDTESLINEIKKIRVIN